MTELAGIVLEAALELMRRPCSRVSARTRRTLLWLREVAVPPQGIELRTLDGGVYTGVLVIDRNRPVAMLAARTAPAAYPPPASPPQGRLVPRDEWAWDGSLR